MKQVCNQCFVHYHFSEKGLMSSSCVHALDDCLCRNQYVSAIASGSR